MLNLTCVLTPAKTYFTNSTAQYVYSHYDYLYNGKCAEGSFEDAWRVVSGRITSVEELVKADRINYRYELLDPELVSDKIPLVIPKSEAIYRDDDGYTVWYKKYRMYESLYNLVSDEQPERLVPVKFNLNVILTLEHDIDHVDFNYNVGGSTHQKLDQILFPVIALPERPAMFTSKQMYKIVRNWVKQHINYDWAEISSDYDFCFLVEKLVVLREPIVNTVEQKTSVGRSYKNRRYRTSTIKHRSYTVFEMTFSPENYRDYTPITAMTADTDRELCEKVEAYLTDLMETINSPLRDCPHCNGMGVIIEV